MVAVLLRALARRIVAAAEVDLPRPAGPTTPAPSEEETSGVTAESVFHDAALKYLDQQIASNIELDTRTGQSFAIGSTVLTIAFGLLRLSQSPATGWAKAGLVAALGAYGCVLGFCFLASLYRRMQYRPDIPTLRTYVADLSGADLQLWVALEYMASSEANERIITRKSRLVGAATFFLFIEGICLSTSALLIVI